MSNRQGITAHDKRVLEGVARDIGSMIGPHFDRIGAGFMLMGFTYGPNRWTTYVSNAQRPDMIKALREMADTLEMETDVPALHGQSGTPDKRGGEAG